MPCHLRFLHAEKSLVIYGYAQLILLYLSTIDLHSQIIYYHSEIINNLVGYSSQVIHIKKKKSAKWKTSLEKRFNMNSIKETGWQINQIEAVKKFKYNWFSSNVSIKDNLNFNPKSDFVILPEIFAHLAEDLLIKNKIKYAIFVQNGYSIFSTNNEKKLNKAYNKASFILSYSEDVNQCVKLLFPHLKKKARVTMKGCGPRLNKFSQAVTGVPANRYGIRAGRTNMGRGLGPRIIHGVQPTKGSNNPVCVNLPCSRKVPIVQKSYGVLYRYRRQSNCNCNT